MSTENVMARFRRLTAGAPQLIGDIQSTSAGVAVVQLPGGQLVQARGPGSIGDRVFVQGGVIQGPAPSLPLDLVVI